MLKGKSYFFDKISYGEKGNGTEYGVASHYVDLDRWNGTSDDILEYFGLTGQPEPEPTLEEKVDKLWEAHPELH